MDMLIIISAVFSAAWMIAVAYILQPVVQIVEKKSN